MLPVALEFACPLMQRADGFGVEAIHHLTALATDGDQADVAENAEVLGNGGLFEVHAGDDFGDGAFLQGEEAENVAAAGLGDGVEGVGRGGGERHGWRIHTYMGICQEKSSVWKKSWLAERTGGGGVAHGALLLSSTQGVMWIVALGRDGRQARHAVSVLLYRGCVSTFVLVNLVGAIEVRRNVRAVESQRRGGGVAAGKGRERNQSRFPSKRRRRG